MMMAGADGGPGDRDLGGSEPDASPADAGESDLGPEEDLGPVDLGAEDDLGTAPADTPVQCREDADCTTGTCNLSAPGGICLGCTAGSCPSGTDCSELGSCVRDCTTVADCAPGFRCLGSGRCALATPCSASNCPAPYVCGAVGCERPPCADGCPTDWTCSGGYCTEPV